MSGVIEQLIRMRQYALSGVARMEAGYQDELTYRAAYFQEPERYTELRTALADLVTEVAKARDAAGHDQAERRGLL